MKLSLDHIIRLARLHLDPDEQEELEPQLDRIIGYIEQLGTVDLSDIPPTGHGNAPTMPLRKDEVEESLGRDVLDQAPDADGEYFFVPAVFQNDE